MTHCRFKHICLLSILCLTLAGCGAPAKEDTQKDLTKQTADRSIAVYSARSEHLVADTFKAFTKETGIKVRYVTDKAGALITRLVAEGVATKADVLLTADAGNLWHAQNQNVLQAVDSDILESNIPNQWRDPDGFWYGLSLRARIIVYHPDRVAVEELQSYAQLADPKWQGRLCLRTSKKVYTQSLVASLLAHYGFEHTKNIVSGWVRNLALPPFANDTQTIQALLVGRCDVAVVNNYYYSRLQHRWQQQTKNWPLAIHYPQPAPPASYGTHVNISGAGIIRHAPNPKLALMFLEWLSSNKGQTSLAIANYEYIINPILDAPKNMAPYNLSGVDEISVIEFGRRQKEAILLMDAVDYY